MNLDVEYLSTPVALRMTFSEIPHPMRLQSAVYPNGEQAQDALMSLQVGTASSVADLYCFVQPGDEATTFSVGAYGADTVNEEDAWQLVNSVLTSGKAEHMPPPRLMQTLDSARSSRNDDGLADGTWSIL